MQRKLKGERYFMRYRPLSVILSHNNTKLNIFTFITLRKKGLFGFYCMYYFCELALIKWQIS